MVSSKPLHLSISARASKLVLLLPLLAASQDAPTTIRTETRAVQVDVAVRDSHGAPVHGLTKDDFTLLGDGKPRAIAFFSAEAGGPAPDEAPPVPAPSTTPRVLSNTAPSNVPHEALTVILLDASSPTLDDPIKLERGYLNNGGVGLGYLAQARKGAIDAMAKLPEKERIAIYHISPGGLKVVQDFTTDRDLLRKSIKAWSIPTDWKPTCGPTVKGLAQPIAVGPGVQASSDHPEADALAAGACAKITENSIRMGAVSVLDSMRVLGEKLARLPGRKNLIWVTPGFPMRWLVSMDAQSQKALARLNDANVALNAIDVRGVGPGLVDPQVTVMQSMTEAAGGKTYLQNDIGGAILKADEAVRTNYTLGFYLADTERDGNFHKLEVRTSRAGLSLSYRKGYVAEKVSGSAPTKESPETELLNPAEATDIGITGAVEITPGMPNPTLHLKLSLDPRGLTLRPHDNGSAFKVTRMFAELDARGTILVEGQDSKEFVVPPQSAETIFIEGIHWEQTLPLVPGGVKVRVIVRDEATGKAGTLTLQVGDPR
jgi:VWFA-related protein